MTPAARRTSLFIALAVTTVVYVLAPAPEASDALVALPAGKANAVSASDLRPAPAAQVAGGAAPVVRVLRAREAATGAGQADAVFATPAWAVPPKPQPAPVVEARPVSPPEPAPPRPPAFKVAGLYQDGQDIAVFLLSGERAVVARAGDTIEGDYRVLSIDPSTLRLQHIGTRQEHAIELSSRK